MPEPAVADVRRTWVKRALRRARRWTPYTVSRAATCESCGARISPGVGRWSVNVYGLLNGTRAVIVCRPCADTLPFAHVGGGRSTA